MKTAYRSESYGCTVNEEAQSLNAKFAFCRDFFLHSYLFYHFPVLQTLARDAFSGNPGENREYSEECEPEPDIHRLGGIFGIGNRPIVERAVLDDDRSILRFCRFRVDKPISHNYENETKGNLCNAHMFPFCDTEIAYSEKQGNEGKNEKPQFFIEFIRFYCVRKVEYGDIREIESDKKSDNESENDPSEEDGPIFRAFLEKFDEFKHRLGDRK